MPPASTTNPVASASSSQPMSTTPAFATTLLAPVRARCLGQAPGFHAVSTGRVLVAAEVPDANRAAAFSDEANDRVGDTCGGVVVERGVRLVEQQELRAR